jgi:8-oxo-dGTP pyrophosphatase MutT (NUDIX family)
VSRIVVLDAGQKVLLVGYNSSGPSPSPLYWVPPGGALETGETHREAASRELREETGLEANIGRELWERRFEFQLSGELVYQVERYFLVRLATTMPSVCNTSPEAIEEHKWWSLIDLQETQDTVYPDGLSDDLHFLIGEGAG